MGTKSNRSSGTQHTPKGVNQGTVLVDPKTGLPINTIDGKLDVNATVSASIGEVILDAATSSIRIEDPDTGFHVKVNTNGSIDANVEIDAADGDNVLAVGTEDGTISGTRHVAKIGSDGKLEVKDTAADASLAAIDSKLGSPLPLPTGAATAANQTTGNASLSSIDAKITTTVNGIKVDGSAVTQPVSAVSLPLPTGAATETTLALIKTKTDNLDVALSTIATQSTLASVDGKLNSLGQKTKAGSVPVTLASDQDPIAVTGSFTASVALDAFTKAPPDNVISVGTEDGLLTGTKHTLKVGTDNKLEVKDTAADSSLSSIDTKITTTINGVKVDGSAVTQPISAAALPLPSGAATEAKQDVGNSSLSNIDGKLNSLGQKAMAASVPVVFASDQSPLPISGTINADLDAFSATPDNVMLVGTEDGSKTGTKRGFVNNIFNQINATEDKARTITYADPGTKFQRPTRIDIVSSHFPALTARTDIAYSDAGTKFQRPITLTRSIV